MSARAALGRLLLAAVCIAAGPAPGAAAGDLLLGFYGSADAASLAAAAGTPLDHLIPYGIEGLDEARIRAFLDEAAAKKVSVVFSVKDAFRESKWYPAIDWCPTAEEAPLVACIAKKFGGHPAVGGWYLADEPTNLLGRFKGDKLRANAAAIRANSDKPILAEEVALPRGKHWELLDEVADLLLVTAYPVPDRPLADAYTRVAELHAGRRKPVVAVVQVFDKANVPFFREKGIAGRPPLAAEVRAMSYLALLAGAEGIVYYSIPQLRKIPDWQQRLSALAGIAAELRASYPVIRSGERLLGRYAVTAAEGVYHVERRSGGSDRVVAVNSTDAPQQLRVAGEGADGKPVALEVTLGALEVRLVALPGTR
jgi:hypothetical protein